MFLFYICMFDMRVGRIRTVLNNIHFDCNVVKLINKFMHPELNPTQSM